MQLVHTVADDFAAEVKKLCQTTVTDRAWKAFLDAHTPIPEQPGRGRTNAADKRSALTRLWTSDSRVSPWKNTGWGVVQAVNTHLNHEAVISGASRAERNMTRVMRGELAKNDRATHHRHPVQGPRRRLSNPGPRSITCGTDGWTNTGHGISIAVSRPSVYRCHDCIACLDALAPLDPGFTDERAYADRDTELSQLNVTTLWEQAAPLLATIDPARDAFTMLADLIGPALARDVVTAITDAGDRSSIAPSPTGEPPTATPNTTRAPHRPVLPTGSITSGQCGSTAAPSAPFAASPPACSTATSPAPSPDPYCIPTRPRTSSLPTGSVHAAADALTTWTADREPAIDAVAPGHT
nr:DUF932 domain-containing protein [Amycolatopsis sp. SID8362]